MDRIQLRRDSSDNWAKVNPILLEGEVGFETDTKLRKIGDGVHRWNELEYLKAENILQEIGISENATMSQAVITRELSKLGSEVNNEISSFKETVTNQVNNYRPIEIHGDVTNAADEEDITSDENNLLKLKDRNNLNGMGYVILRNNKAISEQIVQSNAIYEIRYNFDLNGKEVVIPEGCILKFDGGSVCNGTLNLTNTIILNNVKGSLLVKIKGTIVGDFNLYNVDAVINRSHIEACHTNINIMEDINVDYFNLSANITGNGYSIFLSNEESISIKIVKDGLTIENVKLLKDITESNRKRVIYSNNINHIKLLRCKITGQCQFSADEVNIGGYYIVGNIFDVDYRSIDNNQELQNDILLFQGIENVVIENNTIKAKNITRVLKTTAGNSNIVDGKYLSYSLPSNNFIIQNNYIYSNSSNGKQIYDMFIGSSNIVVKNNKIVAIGHTRIFENKTSQDLGSSIDENNSLNILISDNVIVSDGEFIYFNIAEKSIIKITNNIVWTKNTSDNLIRLHNIDNIYVEKNIIHYENSNNSPCVLISEDYNSLNTKLRGLYLSKNTIDGMNPSMFVSARNCNIDTIELDNNNIPSGYIIMQIRDNVNIGLINVTHYLYRGEAYLIQTLDGSTVEHLTLNVSNKDGNKLLLNAKNVSQIQTNVAIKELNGNLLSCKIKGATSERPKGVVEGFQFFDVSLKKTIWWTGSAWVDATGAIV